MSAEILRRAAALMQARAHAATPGPWSHEGAPNGFPAMVVGQDMVVADTHDKPHMSDAAHIASWHPAVALAVAAWLDATAGRYELVRGTFRPGSVVGVIVAAENTAGLSEAFAVAYAYLGETP